MEQLNSVIVCTSHRKVNALDIKLNGKTIDEKRWKGIEREREKKNEEIIKQYLQLVLYGVPCTAHGLRALKKKFKLE